MEVDMSNSASVTRCLCLTNINWQNQS